MPAYSRLTDADLHAIRVAADAGSTPAAIAAALDRDPATIRYWLAHKSRGPTRKPPKRARRLVKATKARREVVRKLASAKVKVKHRERRKYSGSGVIAAVLKREHDIHVHPSTIRRDLNAMGFRRLTRHKNMAFNTLELRNRVAFARRRGPTGQYMFTDEKTFTCGDYTDNREWVPPGQQPTQKDRSSSAQDTVYVWGAIAKGFRHLVVIRRTSQKVKQRRKRNFEERPNSERMTSSTYIRRCLSGKVVDFCLRNKVVLQADGHRAHYSQETRDYLDPRGVQYTADWPARSPDLNPIENLWAIMQTEVSKLVPLTSQELEAAIWTVWNALPQDVIDAHVDSFPGRCRVVVKKRGYMTK